MADSIRVLIADDHLIIREGLSLILETAPDIELVGEASNGEEAVEMAQSLQPDVVLMDLSMPVMDGIEAIGRLRVALPDAAIVILTTYNEDDLLLRGLRAGARAYLLKDTDRPTLLETIRAAARGETLLKPDILARLLDQTTARGAHPLSSSPVDLTEREIEVLRAAARGERSKEIAAQLDISERTVKAHLASIYNKLGVDSRAAAVAAAAGLGLLTAMD